MGHQVIKLQNPLKTLGFLQFYRFKTAKDRIIPPFHSTCQRTVSCITLRETVLCNPEKILMGYFLRVFDSFISNPFRRTPVCTGL